jgi:hypothetical protein
MPISAAQKQTADLELTDYCDSRIPQIISGKLRLIHRWRGTTVTLIEQRPWWRDETTWVESPVAQFRFDNQGNDWMLYWRDRNQRWHRYEDHPGPKSITRLLAEVDQDLTGLFWG